MLVAIARQLIAVIREVWRFPHTAITIRLYPYPDVWADSGYPAVFLWWGERSVMVQRLRGALYMSYRDWAA